MTTEDYNRAESKECLIDFLEEMAAAWEDFLTFEDAALAMLEDIWENETEKSFKAILKEIGFSGEDADAITARCKEGIYGQNEE
jgi:hypothetical protein